MAQSGAKSCHVCHISAFCHDQHTVPLLSQRSSHSDSWVSWVANVGYIWLYDICDYLPPHSRWKAFLSYDFSWGGYMVIIVIILLFTNLPHQNPWGSSHWPNYCQIRMYTSKELMQGESSSPRVLEFTGIILIGQSAKLSWSESTKKYTQQSNRDHSIQIQSLNSSFSPFLSCPWEYTPCHTTW